MKEYYRKIIKQQGLRTCPFCGEAMEVEIADWGSVNSNVKKLYIRHRRKVKGFCVFEEIFRIVTDKEETVLFLYQWNRRDG